MQRRKWILSLALFSTLAAFAGTASAELSIERDISITDDAGGTLVMLTLASRDHLGGEGTTTATFDGFQAATDRRRIDGEVVRQRMATADRIETRYDGALEILTPGSDTSDERLDTLIFDNLTSVRDGHGPELAGLMTFNGETREVSDLPPRALRILSRVLRFFHFA